jgi:hypothetical protein
LILDHVRVFQAANDKWQIIEGNPLIFKIPFRQYASDGWEVRFVKDVAQSIASITSIYIGHNSVEALSELFARLFQCIDIDPIELTPNLRVQDLSWHPTFPSSFVPLIICDEWNTKTGGISAFNLQLARGLREKNIQVYCLSVKKVPKEDLDVANKDGVVIIDVETKIFPEIAKKLENSLTSNQRASISHIIGHAHITGEEAMQIRNLRSFSHCIIWQINHIVARKNEPLKPDGSREEREKKGLEKEKLIKKYNKNADHVFSVGPTMYNEYHPTLEKQSSHHLLILPYNPIFKKKDKLPFKNDRKLNVILFGRVGEAFYQKGIDISCLGCSKALKSLDGINIKVRGSPDGHLYDVKSKIFRLLGFDKRVNVANLDLDMPRFPPAFLR